MACGFCVTSAKSRSSCRGAILALLLILIPALKASGQFMQEVPEPISSADLMRYATRLHLSEAQWPAIEAAHDEYKRWYDDFKNGPVAEHATSLMGRVSSTDQEILRAQLKQQQELHVQVGTLDRRFFDQWQTVLSETQLPALQRVRRSRERQRLGGNRMLLMMSGRVPPDVSEVFLAHDLPAPEIERADPLILQYEQRLTSEMRELHALMDDATLSLALGFADMQAETEEAERPQEDRMRQTEALFSRCLVDVNAKVAELHDLNRQTVRRVVDALSPEIGPGFRMTYRRAAHPQLVRLALQTHRWPASLRALQETDDEVGEALDGLVSAYQLRVEPLINRYLEVTEEVRASRNIFSANRNPDPDLTKRMNRAREDLVSANTQTVDALTELVGQELAGRIMSASDEHKAWMSRDSTGARDAEGLNEAVAAAADLGPEQNAGDAYVPRRLARARVVALVEALALDDQQRVVLDALYGDYALGYREVQRGEVEKIKKLNQSLWARDPETGRSGVGDIDNLPRITETRRAAQAKVESLDREFFDQLEALFSSGDNPPPALARLRSDRARERVIGSNRAAMYIGLGRSARAVDLLALCRNLDDTGLTPEAVDDVFDEYGPACLGLLETLYHRSLDIEEAQMRLMLEFRRRQENDDGIDGYGELHQQIMAEPQSRYTEAAQAFARLNRATMDRIQSQFDAIGWATLEDAYRHQAYPDVYRDAQAMHKQLRLARTLDDLTPEQRLELDQEALDYRHRYDACCVRLVELQEEQQVFMLARNDDRAAMSEEEQRAFSQRFRDMRDEEERLRFERDELNTRAIRKLRTLLSADQLRRVGGMPEPKASGRFR